MEEKNTQLEIVDESIENKKGNKSGKKRAAKVVGAVAGTAVGFAGKVFWEANKDTITKALAKKSKKWTNSFLKATHLKKKDIFDVASDAVVSIVKLIKK